MFGKIKKQKSKSPVEEMEQFYMNQFLNNSKTPPQGYNGMTQNRPGFNPMMGNNQQMPPQLQGREQGRTPLGGFNSMMNQNQMGMGANNFNQNDFSMMNNNFNPNIFPMNTPPSANNTPFFNNHFNQASIMNNSMNQNQVGMMGNNMNQNPYQMQGDYFQQAQLPNQMAPNSYNNYNTLPDMSQSSANLSYFNQVQAPSLIQDSLNANIGAEPSNLSSFPGQFSFNDFSYAQPPQQSLPDLTPSLEDLTGTNILSNPYFQPENTLIEDSQVISSDLTVDRTQAILNSSNPTSHSNTQTSNCPPLQANQPNSFQSYSPANLTSSNPSDIKNKIDNINIRLRKVENYLGFRPDTTI
ncbi:MAG: hypothetical protein K2G70_06665 [Turicibacter sp.]|nr:hypothetical protein [Turicibacter sp.]